MTEHRLSPLMNTNDLMAFKEHMHENTYQDTQSTQITYTRYTENLKVFLEPI